jgi:hypothetical protein
MAQEPPSRPQRLSSATRRPSVRLVSEGLRPPVACKPRTSRAPTGASSRKFSAFH